MTPKTICLIIFDTLEAEWLIAQACDLAVACDAHLIALHPYAPMVFYGGVATDPYIFPTIAEWEEKESDKIRAMFEEAARRNDLRAEYRGQKTLYGAEPFLQSSARAADLVVTGSHSPKYRAPDDRALAERLIRDLGRPVLVMSPDQPLSKLASKLLIGWSDTREAARAAHDALMLAAPNASVELVSLLTHAEDNPPGLDGRDDLAAALDRRGFVVTTTDRVIGALGRAGPLQDIASAGKADLLVTGAFGHSYVYDFVIGAVTRDLLNSARLPLLISN